MFVHNKHFENNIAMTSFYRSSPWSSPLNWITKLHERMHREIKKS